MATHITTTVHADFGDLDASRLSSDWVVVRTRSSGDNSVSLFLGLGGHYGKQAALACLARWVELVEALPDDEVP